MTYLDFQELEVYMSQPEQLLQSQKYLGRQMKQFLRKHDRVIICVPASRDKRIGDILEGAVSETGADAMRIGPDYRWKTLLKIAFSSRASVIMAPPNVVLGLTKLAKATQTPLFIRHVLTAGYPCLDWMIDGIRRGLDCQTWGCFIPGGGTVVTGFSCGHNTGIHLRDELFDVQVLDKMGKTLPEGQKGELLLTLKQNTRQSYTTGEFGRVQNIKCACGSTATYLTDFSITDSRDPIIIQIYEQMYSWTSILDCHVVKGRYGLELEIVKFAGEKLPRLPDCAKLILRSWNPELDEPFHDLSDLKNTDLSWETY